MGALLAALLGARIAAAGSFVPVVDADLRGAFSAARKGGKGAGGLVGDVLVLPGWRITSGSTLLPIYALDASLYNRVVEEDILYQSRQVHAGSLGFKQRIGAFDARISFDADYALTKESKGEKLGDGLYDYRDFGGRLGFGWREAGLSAGVRGYRRSYVHYFSLSSRNQAYLASVNPGAAGETREHRPKDFDGMDVTVGWGGTLAERVKVKADYLAGLRAYRDKYVRTDQGQMSDVKRFDTVHRVAGGAALGMGSFSFGADLEGIFNVSNASIYDANQPKHAFLPHYFQFWSAGLSPSVLWTLPVSGERKPKVRLSAGFTGRAFPFRYAQDANGVYTDARQQDLEYSGSLGASYPLAKWLWLTADVGGRVVRSNSKYEQFIQTNYELLTASLGLHLSY